MVEAAQVTEGRWRWRKCIHCVDPADIHWSMAPNWLIQK